jgi:uncharacterized protein (TIGR01777 family)
LAGSLEAKMNVLISGGSGLIGSALTHSLLADAHQVWILTRSPASTNLPAGAQPVAWDGRTNTGWLDVFSQMDVVVNLAGETVGKWPWSEAHKKRILDSRVNAGHAIAGAFQKAAKKPAVLIQSSGIGYYGPYGKDPITEEFPAGNDFMASVAAQWEASTRMVDVSLGVRRVIIRTSLVLDARQGVLPLMALPVRFFAGGPLGSGLQGVSWIHIDDEVRAIRFLMENDAARGAFNLSAPNPLSNANFLQDLARVLSRPYWLPAPAFALRALLGEMSTLLLDGQYALPQRLIKLGFVFRYASAEQAFRALF